MSNPANEALLIFVKNPELGKVKTRLAETIGNKKALEVYQKLLGLTQKAVDPLEVDCQVWYSSFIDETDRWPNTKYGKCLQKGEGLGARMQEAFRQNFENGKQKVVIIGSDCAELTTDTIHRAYTLLDQQEVVVGPSQDGGYYLLGMSTFYPQLFEQKEWSTSSVCSQTVRQLQEENISYQLLPELNDIDTESDLRQSQVSWI